MKWRIVRVKSGIRAAVERSLRSLGEWLQSDCEAEHAYLLSASLAADAADIRSWAIELESLATRMRDPQQYSAGEAW